MKAHKVKFDGQEYLLTDEQYDRVCAAMAKSAQPAARALEMKAKEARFLWDDLDKGRKETFFLTREIADLANKSPFPPESLVKSAESAAQKVDTAIKSHDPRTIIDAIDAAQKPINAASTALHAYLDGFFAGTDRIITGLKI
ncbi:MAG: hypothetical protein KGI51_07815, partial [Rhodospirillales bacterium]|nr:hypothetical protein [Rhodospirillales bacterium]